MVNGALFYGAKVTKEQFLELVTFTQQEWDDEDLIKYDEERNILYRPLTACCCVDDDDNGEKPYIVGWRSGGSGGYKREYSYSIPAIITDREKRNVDRKLLEVGLEAEFMIVAEDCCYCS